MDATLIEKIEQSFPPKDRIRAVSLLTDLYDEQLNPHLIEAINALSDGNLKTLQRYLELTQSAASRAFIMASYREKIGTVELDRGIEIDDQEYLAMVPVDPSAVAVRDISQLLTPLNVVFDQLESACVRECCGFQAFSFKAADIRALAIQDMAAVKMICKTLVEQISGIEEPAVLVKQLNQHFEKATFVALLQHIEQQLC